MYRALTARVNYLTQDCSDIQFAVKELSRTMSKPCVGDLKKLKRLGRYLISRTRSVVSYNYQSNPKSITPWVDSDYAGCRRTRKSTSGGLTMFGAYLIKLWATTQGALALSSGEAEYYSIVKGASIALGIRNIMKDMEVEGNIKIETDASAAKGIASRRGAGKIRHIEVSQLWIISSSTRRHRISQDPHEGEFGGCTHKVCRQR